MCPKTDIPLHKLPRLKKKKLAILYLGQHNNRIVPERFRNLFSFGLHHANVGVATTHVTTRCASAVVYRVTHEQWNTFLAILSLKERVGEILDIVTLYRKRKKKKK